LVKTQRLQPLHYVNNSFKNNFTTLSGSIN